MRTALQNAMKGLPFQGSTGFPQGIGFQYDSVPCLRYRTCVCVYLCILKMGTEQYNARKLLSQSHLLQLTTGFNASEVNEREFNPDFLAVTCRADHA